MVVARLDAKLEDNRESFELRKVEPASVEHGLGGVEHLVRQGGDLHEEGCHAGEESEGPWVGAEEIENPRPDILFHHDVKSKLCLLKVFQVKLLLSV